MTWDHWGGCKRLWPHALTRQRNEQGLRVPSAGAEAQWGWGTGCKFHGAKPRGGLHRQQGDGHHRAPPRHPQLPQLSKLWHYHDPSAQCCRAGNRPHVWVKACKETWPTPPHLTCAPQFIEGMGTWRALQDQEGKESSKQEQVWDTRGRDAPSGPLSPSPVLHPSLLHSPCPAPSPHGQQDPALCAGGRVCLLPMSPTGCSSRGCCILRHYCINIYIFYIYIALGAFTGRQKALLCF